MKTAFKRAVKDAGIADATAHDLKHTAVTWAFQSGMSMTDAVGWFETSSDTFERIYREHSPEHQGRARAIIERRGR